MLGTVISLFFISKPDGQKILTTTAIQQDVIHVVEQIKNQITRLNLDTFSDISVFTDNNNSETESATLYRWQDKQGQWHFSDDINKAQGTNTAIAETIIITANTSLATPQSQTAAPAVNNSQPAPQSVSNSMPAQPLTNALDILQDSKNIQTLMDKHDKQFDNAIKNIAN